MISFGKFRKEKYTYLEAKEKGQIDEKCIPLCDLFNRVGLDTEFSCQGHLDGEEFVIIFEYYLSDSEIINFIKLIGDANSSSKSRGKFSKWYRYDEGILLTSWMYVARGTMIQIEEDINIDFKRFKNIEALI